MSSYLSSGSGGGTDPAVVSSLDVLREDVDQLRADLAEWQVAVHDALVDKTVRINKLRDQVLAAYCAIGFLFVALINAYLLIYGVRW